MVLLSGAPMAVQGGSFLLINVTFSGNNAVKDDVSKWYEAFNSHEKWCAIPPAEKKFHAAGFYPKPPKGSPCNQGFLTPYYECRYALDQPELTGTN